MRKKLPKYASLDGGSELILLKNRKEYYRVAGCWGINYYWDGDILRAKSDDSRLSHVNGLVLMPSTEEKWREDNHGYVDNFNVKEEDYIITNHDDDEIPF